MRNHKYRNHKRKKLTFHESIKKYGLLNATTYRIKKARIPKWIWIASIVMIITGTINSLYKINLGFIDIIPMIFYISEIAIVGYLVFRLMKRLDRIRAHSNMQLMGLKLLAGIFGGIAIFLFFFLFISPMFAMMFEPMENVVYFGKDFGLAHTGQVFLMVVFVGFCFICGHLQFKFQRKTGTFHWIGRA